MTTLAFLALLVCSPRPLGDAGAIVVANRNAGSISVIDVATDRVVADVPLPAAAAPSEPMYVESAGGYVLVGDRGNDRVVAYAAPDYKHAGDLPTGAGVFHMKADAAGEELWVANDIDNTFTAIDLAAFAPIGDFPLPADLIAQGGKPHDIVVGRDFGFVSMIGVEGPNDFVVQYSRSTYTETGRVAIGDDPHLALHPASRFLFVPAQEQNAVNVFQRDDLALFATIPAAGAHGAALVHGGETFYTTNLPGGGAGGLVTIDAGTFEVLGTTDTPFPTPHNIAVTSTGKVYVTHSGAEANQVTVYSASAAEPVPSLAGRVLVGTNPFGIAYVP